MRTFPSASRYFLYLPAADMRKSYNGLGILVKHAMKQDLLSGDGYVFVNKRRTMIKILIWDRNGTVIYQKRLSRGTIQLPNSGGKISSATLMMMLEGVDLRSIKYRKRYHKRA